MEIKTMRTLYLMLAMVILNGCGGNIPKTQNSVTKGSGEDLSRVTEFQGVACDPNLYMLETGSVARLCPVRINGSNYACFLTYSRVLGYVTISLFDDSDNEIKSRYYTNFPSFTSDGWLPMVDIQSEMNEVCSHL